MNEFNIIKYLYDIKLKEVFGIIKAPNKEKGIIEEYLFQGKDENDEFVCGKIIITNNKIAITYNSDLVEKEKHLFSSEMMFYTTSDYLVLFKHSLLNDKNQETIIEKKYGKNIPKRNIFNFNQKIKQKTMKKVLVNY